MATDIQYVFARVEKKYMLTRTQRDALFNRIGPHLIVCARVSYKEAL